MKRKIILGHRANTHEKMEKVLKEGGDGFEVDVRLDLNRVPILFHDRNVKNEKVEALTIEKLKILTNIRILSLEEALGLFPNQIWDIEIKTRRCYGRTLEIIKRSAAKKIMISSFIHPLIESKDGVFEKAIILDNVPLENEINLKETTSIVWDYEIVTKELIETKEKLGIKNWVYGIETVEEIRELKTWPIEGIITDDIKSASEGLKD